ncbi:hypothetical protein ACHAWO_003487 [Cyclotella atomus]|uniref:Uncharacterized protein n=1 Tax=Cyclotella atomus TaxID=382360 RepID=A0ABD3PLI1_9STRA
MLKIFKTAARGNHSHEEAAWILTTHDAIGRPGKSSMMITMTGADLLTELVDTYVEGIQELEEVHNASC